MMQALRGARAKMSGRLLLSQWVGNFVLMLLAAAWLQIPDSHAWQFAFSMLSGVLLVVVFFWLYTATFHHLRPCAEPAPRWLSWLLLAGFIALWWLMLQVIAVGRAHEALYAGYWNSQSPPWLRHSLGYSSLVAWQERFYDCLQCLWAGLLLPMAIVLCASGIHKGCLRHGAAPYKHWFYWLAVLVCGLGGSAITWALADWTPDAGLVGQTFSVVARLGIAYTVDILLWCFVLALAAYYLETWQSPSSEPANPA
jgi:hypothetical protein